MKRVLFVCMGNICRSPAAEGVMKHVVAARGAADRVEVDSAGTIGYHTGERADRRMLAAAARRGYDLTSRARQIAERDLDAFDLVVAMDADNLRDIERVADPRATHRAAIRLLGDFLASTPGRDVPDPYYGGLQGFEEVLNMCEEACPAILDELLAE